MSRPLNAKELEELGSKLFEGRTRIGQRATRVLVVALFHIGASIREGLDQIAAEIREAGGSR